MLILSSRQKDGETFELKPQECDPEMALIRFFLYELGYGGKVIDATTESITAETWVMGCRDETIIKGTPEEMKVFLELSAMHYQINNAVIDRDSDALMKVTRGNPRAIELSGSIIFGAAKIQKTMIIALFLEAPLAMQTEELIDELNKKNTRDLLAAYCMIKYDNVSFDEVKSLL